MGMMERKKRPRWGDEGIVSGHYRGRTWDAQLSEAETGVIHA